MSRINNQICYYLIGGFDEKVDETTFHLCDDRPTHRLCTSPPALSECSNWNTHHSTPAVHVDATHPLANCHTQLRPTLEKLQNVALLERGATRAQHRSS